MTSRDFAFWLQGFFELQRAEAPNSQLVITAKQATMIERHLHLVFEHDIDPSIDGNDPALKAKLNVIHTAGSLSAGLFPVESSEMRPRC